MNFFMLLLLGGALYQEVFSTVSTLASNQDLDIPAIWKLGNRRTRLNRTKSKTPRSTMRKAKVITTEPSKPTVFNTAGTSGMFNNDGGGTMDFSGCTVTNTGSGLKIAFPKKTIKNKPTPIKRKNGMCPKVDFSKIYQFNQTSDGIQINGEIVYRAPRGKILSLNNDLIYVNGELACDLSTGQMYIDSS